MYTIGAFAVITDNDDKILLAQRTDNNLWNLPGGRVEPLESPWDAVKRECAEEIGIVVRVESLLGVYSKDFMNDIVFQFLCTIESGKPGKSDEAKEVGYFLINELDASQVSQNHYERIRDYYFDKDKIVLKIQSE